MPRSITVHLSDASLVGDARRRGTELARNLGFDEPGEAKVGLVVSEAASNVMKHGENGWILLRILDGEGCRGLEVLAVDKGRGMADVSRCLEDGYSTAGSSGTGLGAIKRLSNVFDIYSQESAGTVLLSQLWPKNAAPFHPRMDVGCVCVPKQNEEECGDVWTFQSRPSSALFLVADGLGHGPMAARAADEAARVFDGDQRGRPREILNAAHGPLRATRGASVAVAQICFEEGTLHYAGIGNISGRILNENSNRSLVSHDGTLGHELRRVQEFSYPWNPRGLLVLHSDGLMTRWTLDAYPGLALRHPALVAGVLFRDFQRGRDDVTVLVAREHLNNSGAE